MAVLTKQELLDQNDANMTTNGTQDITGAKVNSLYENIIESTIIDKEYTCFFPEVNSELPILFEIATTIMSIVLGNALVVEYNNDGGGWNVFSTAVNVAAGKSIRFRVTSFDTTLDGTIIIKTQKT
jgi:hypothetical protein